MKFLVISIFLLLIVQIMNDQVCGGDSGKSITRNDCFANSTSEKYCCYDGNTTSCKLVNKNELSNTLFDCGISEENYGKYEFGQYYPEQDLGVDIGLQSCGKNGPKSRGDCTDYSQLTNSCCRFSVGGKSGCFFIGKKYLGKIEKKNFKFNNSDTQIEYECNSFNLMPKLFLLFSILLFL